MTISTAGAIICISVVSWSDPWTDNDRAEGPASPTRPIQSITMGLPDNHRVADITIPQPGPYKISQEYNHGLGILMYQFQQHALYKISQKFKHHTMEYLIITLSDTLIVADITILGITDVPKSKPSP